MVITEVRIKLCEENNERLLAFCSVTFDNAFVVRDLKIIEGTKGMFVAMPSRKLTDRCYKCGCKNHLRARFCNSCGGKLDEHRAMRDTDGRAKLHADIAHPIHSRRPRTDPGRGHQGVLPRRRSGPSCPATSAPTTSTTTTHEDVPVSYGAVVTEMGSGVKPHGPHAAPKGTHFNTDAPAAKMPAKGDDFASGIV